MVTWVICASGPSLTVDDVQYVRESGVNMACVNNTWELMPDADLLYAADAHWWQRIPSGKRALKQFKGAKYCASKSCCNTNPELIHVEVNTRKPGWNTAGDWVYGGRLSGYQVLQVVGRFNPDRIILLGYDMQHTADGVSHWHGDHPDGFANCPNVAKYVSGFNTLAQQAAAAGVTILNATRTTALNCFERIKLSDAI